MIATNTTLARDAVAGDAARASEAGGLSGAPLFERSTAVVRVLARALDGALPIIGVGGIDSGERRTREDRRRRVAGAALHGAHLPRAGPGRRVRAGGAAGRENTMILLVARARRAGDAAVRGLSHVDVHAR